MADEVEDELEDTEALEPDLDELTDEEDLLEGDLEEEEDTLVEDDSALEEEEEDEGEEGGKPVATSGRSGTTVEEDEEEVDEDEEEDVEASLDVILKERLVVADEEEEEVDEVSDTEDRSDASVKVLPKRPDEFVCQSCFLVKHPSQLADPKSQLCRDCV